MALDNLPFVNLPISSGRNVIVSFNTTTQMVILHGNIMEDTLDFTRNVVHDPLPNGGRKNTRTRTFFFTNG